MRTYYLILLIGIVGLGIGGCRQVDRRDNNVPIEESSSLSAFFSRVSSVRLIPIYDNHLLGSRVELIPAQASFILCDMSNDIILRYDNKGSYLNEIGRKGNGPGEYNHISNVQVIDSSKVAVISPFKGIYYYNTYENHQITAIDMHKTNLDGNKLTTYPLRHGENIFYES